MFVDKCNMCGIILVKLKDGICSECHKHVDSEGNIT